MREQGIFVLLLLAVAHIADTKATLDVGTERRQLLENFSATVSSIRFVGDEIATSIFPELRRHLSLTDEVTLLSVSSGPSGSDGQMITDGVGTLVELAVVIGLIVYYIKEMKGYPSPSELTKPEVKPVQLAAPVALLPVAVDTPIDPLPTIPIPPPRIIADCGSRDSLEPSMKSEVPLLPLTNWDRLIRSQVGSIARPVPKVIGRKVWKDGSMEPRHLEYSDSSLAEKHIGIIPLDADVFQSIRDETKDLTPIRVPPKPRLPVSNNECDDHKKGIAPDMAQAFNIANAREVPIEPAWVRYSDESSAPPAPVEATLPAPAAI